MTEKLLPCPFCGKQVALIDNCHELEDCENFERCESTGYYAVVRDVNEGGCGASGGYARTEHEAISAWNRRAQPTNEPLTIDELRGMDGEPVWCDWVNQWGIVNIDSESRLEFTYCDGSQNTYGEIVSCGIDPMAYRRKPEPEGRENDGPTI